MLVNELIVTYCQSVRDATILAVSMFTWGNRWW